MKYSEEIMEYVKTHWNDLKAEEALKPDFFDNDFERIAWHVNRYYFKGRHRFSANDAEQIVTRYCHNQPKEQT